ncbi:MAG: O-antigen ligase family protein, partial [Thalassolituus sp.]
MEFVAKIRQQPILYITFAAVVTFLCAQAWDMATTTDAAIILWLIGLGYAVVDRGFPAFSPAQKIISILSLATFASYVVSWWGTPYVREIGQLEPAGRFLVLPLIMYAMVRSGMTLRMLAWALIAAGFSYAASAFYEKFYLQVYRVNGDENAVTFGNGAILIFACMSTILVSLKRKREITLVGLSAILVFVAAIYSGSRASLIVLLPLAVILTTIYKKRALPFLIAGILGLTVFALSSNYLTQNIQRSYASIEAYVQKHKTGTSLGQRFLLWESTICINELYPW